MSITREQAIAAITYLGNNLSNEHDDPSFDEWHQISGEDPADFYLKGFELDTYFGLDYAYNYTMEIIFMRALTWSNILPGNHAFAMGEVQRAAFNDAAPGDVVKYLYPDASAITVSSLTAAIRSGEIEAYSLAKSIGLAHIVSNTPSANGLIGIARLVETGYTPSDTELAALFSNTGKPTIEQHIGSDTALDVAEVSGSSSAFKLSAADSKISVVSTDGRQQSFYTDYDRIKFDDKVVAFDIEGNAGQAYRLYKAAFDRVPDKGGLGYWIKELDNGATLLEVAAKFITTPEFTKINGATPNNLEFATSMYQHVLGRAPDQGGLTWWVDQLDTGSRTRSDVLVGFSESSENQIALTGQTQGGIEYLPA